VVDLLLGLLLELPLELLQLFYDFLLQGCAVV
jgi:hypothetical protein